MSLSCLKPSLYASEIELDIYTLVETISSLESLGGKEKAIMLSVGSELISSIKCILIGCSPVMLLKPNFSKLFTPSKLLFFDQAGITSLKVLEL